MNRDGDVENFWNLIERKMSIIFPTYLRNILKLRGYDSAGSIKFITEEDVANFENFARTAMVNRLPENSNKADYFSVYTDPADFEIIPGHKILLQEVVAFIKEMTEEHGNNYFNFYNSVGTSPQPFINKRCKYYSIHYINL